MNKKFIKTLATATLLLATAASAPWSKFPQTSVQNPHPLALLKPPPPSVTNSGWRFSRTQLCSDLYKKLYRTISTFALLRSVCWKRRLKWELRDLNSCLP